MILLHLCRFYDAMPPRPAFVLQYIGSYRAPPDALFGEKKEGVRKGEVKQRERAERGWNGSEVTGKGETDVC